MDYKDIKESKPNVWVVQEIAGTREGRPKFNIMGASEYGNLKFLLDERSQMIFSPGPLIFKLKNLVKDCKTTDYLLLTGDPAIIGVVCCLVSDLTNGKFNLPLSYVLLVIYILISLKYNKLKNNFINYKFLIK